MKLMFKKCVYAHIFTSPGLVFSTLPPPTGKMLWCGFPAVLTHSPCGILQGHTKSLSSIKQTAKNDYYVALRTIHLPKYKRQFYSRF